MQHSIYFYVCPVKARCSKQIQSNLLNYIFLILSFSYGSVIIITIKTRTVFCYPKPECANPYALSTLFAIPTVSFEQFCRRDSTIYYEAVQFLCNSWWQKTMRHILLNLPVLTSIVIFSTIKHTNFLKIKGIINSEQSAPSKK